MEKESETPIFTIDDRGFNVKAFYLQDASGDAVIELRHHDVLVRTMTFPAYKIWNIAAHFSDIVDGELSKDDKARGYVIAGATGVGGCVLPHEVKT